MQPRMPLVCDCVFRLAVGLRGPVSARVGIPRLLKVPLQDGLRLTMGCSSALVTPTAAHPEHLEEAAGVAHGDVGGGEVAAQQELPALQVLLQNVERLERAAQQAIEKVQLIDIDRGVRPQQTLPQGLGFRGLGFWVKP